MDDKRAICSKGIQSKGVKYMSIEELLQIKINSYIENYIINLDLSDSTKNILKRQLRKCFLDKDLIYDLKNSINKEE